MKRIVIIGASGFGKEIAWVVSRLNEVRPSYEVVGFCDDAESKRVGTFVGTPLLGRIEEAAVRYPGISCFCAVGNNRVRCELMARAQASGWLPITLIDRDAVVSPDACVGFGSYVGIGSVISVGSRMGCGVIVNHHVTVGHDVELGDYVQLCPGTRVSGGCTVGAGALFGSNACAIPGVRVGAWATVGVGSAVLRDIDDGGTLVRVR